MPKLLRSLFARAAMAALPLLGGCSSPATDEPRVSTAGPAPAAGPFVGTIRLLQKHFVLGIPRTEYVTLTFEGTRLRREVRPRSLADSTERYGIVADLRADSVTYYLQDATHNLHCRLARADYLARVAANEPILPSLDRRPYSTIFAPLPADAPHQALGKTFALGSLADCRAVLFALPGGGSCQTMYSDRVRVSVQQLAYLEYQPPAALPSLALVVHYTPPPAPSGSSLLDRVKHRLNKLSSTLEELFSSDTDFKSLDTARPSDQDFALPSGSRYAGSADALEATLRESASRSRSHHNHHHH